MQNYTYQKTSNLQEPDIMGTRYIPTLKYGERDILYIADRPRNPEVP